ncbi:MAG: triple tyrosine motif-containing protein [Bacteroidota bacterium]
MRKVRVLLFLLWPLLQSGMANPVEYGISDIEYFNRRQYDGATQNWSVSQSVDGLMYFANNDGIIEYDGTEWRMLPGMPNNVPRSVLARDGKIYLGGNAEFGYYEIDSVGEYQYHSLYDEYDVQEPGDFWNIFPMGETFVFQSQEALCIYDPDEGIEVVPAETRFTEAFLVNDQLLIHDEQEGLMELRGGNLFSVPGGDILQGMTVGAIMPIDKGELVIGTMNNGLYKWDSSGIYSWNVEAGEYLKEANVFCGTKVGNDLAFGTIQSGVVVVDPDGQLKMIAGKDKGLKNNTVLDIFVDKQKNIWAGLDNGIARVGYNSAVSFIQGYFDLGTGYCMTEKDDRFYLGTNQGLYSINRETFASPLKDRDDFHLVNGSNGQVWNFFKDDQGELLAGHNLGIFRIQEEEATLLSSSSVNGAWKFRYVPGNSDKLMVGTYTGLVLLERDDRGKWQFDRKVEGFGESSRDMEWDEEGRLWVSHGFKGLYRLSFNDDYTRVTDVQMNDDFEGLDDFLGFSISKIDDRILFASSQGIYSIEEGSRFVQDELWDFFTGDEGFPTRMKQDRFDNIWFFVDDGVGVLRYQEDGTYMRIDNPLMPLKDKLVSSFESVFVLNNETAFFGTEDGFGQYTVSNDINYYQPFNVHIRGFRSQAREDERFHAGSEDAGQEYVPEFTYQENDFEVFFSATWFGSGKIEYATMLEGYESNWSSWGEIKNRQFTRLPEGKYTFKVKARNVHGVQSRPATFRFVVLPPWYRTTYARVVYGVLIVVLLLSGFFVTRKIVDKSRQREKIRQKERYREKEEQLRREALENEKEMIRLRNEKLQDDMKHKEKELANSTMHIIHKNDVLIKIREELQKARKIGDGNVQANKIASVVKKIDRDIDTEEHWEIFETHLEQVHEDFLKRLNEKHPDLSAREMRLAAYLRMNMTSKEIASLMNITPRAVENNRYKLRKKLGLEQGENLVDYIMKI